MAERVTDKDICKRVEQMQAAGMDVELDGAYGRYAVVNRGSNQSLSPRLPNRHIMDWLSAYSKGWCAAMAAIRRDIDGVHATN